MAEEGPAERDPEQNARPRGRAIFPSSQGIQDRNAADALRGLSIFLPSELATSPEDEYDWRTSSV